jgi:hypothetical protein
MLSIFATAASVMTIYALCSCDYIMIDLPSVQSFTGEIIPAFSGSAGLSPTCSPATPYMGGTKYSAAFALALTSAVLGTLATLLLLIKVGMMGESRVPVLSGISFSFICSAFFLGFTLTVLGRWECDEGSCSLGIGALVAIGAVALWLVCALIGFVSPLK